VRTCPLRVLECRHGLPADNPLSRRGRCPNERCNHSLHCSLGGLVGHTCFTLKLHAARWKLSHNGTSVVLVAQPAVLAGNDFVCAAMSDRNALELGCACMRGLWLNRWRPLVPTRGFGIMIRIKHHSVSSGILLAATSYVHQSFHEEPEQDVSFPAVSSVLLSHWMARRFPRIYPDISGYIPDSAEKPGF